jgi:energy-coupling factor transporter ATP-binding protein EcfA2
VAARGSARAAAAARAPLPGGGDASRVPAGTRGATGRGPLRSGELAEAAVLADVGLVLEVLGWFLPLGGVLQVLAVVPFALLAARRRLRATVVAALAAGLVAFFVGGPGIVLQTAVAASLGAAIGVPRRHGWGGWTVLPLALAGTGVPLAAVSLAADAASPSLRALSFAQLEIAWSDVRAVLRAGGLYRVVERGDALVHELVVRWWVTVPAAELALVALGAVFGLRYLWPLLSRLESASPPVRDDVPVERLAPSVARGAGDPAPVPVRLLDVRYRYPGAARDAVAGCSVRLDPGTLLVLTGPNGSGKSTLARLLAGWLEPTAGEVERAGAAGIGARRGTALVFQRPESQVLGVRVRDDVAFGLPRGERPDLARLLGRVGLAGFEDRETATLSGGELQRLAIAAALARSPRLLVSDESTAMLDAGGRAAVASLLRSLAGEGVAVVHVTHRLEEAEGADVLLRLDAGRALPAGPAHAAGSDGAGASAPRRAPATPPAAAPAASRAPAATRAPGPPVLELRGVGHVYGAGSPWARRALEDVSLEVAAGEGVVLTGPNGSGKSTLAWVAAGLFVPTEGEVRLLGAPVAEARRRVGMAFQHARLQLLRPTVLADVAYGADEATARAALVQVGLDPERFGPRRVDELSGGEQRRVALAGLLVRAPSLIVLDEPFAGLDEPSRDGLARLLAWLRTTHGIALVTVSHDLELAGVLGERLVRLEGGRVVEQLRTGGTGWPA